MLFMIPAGVFIGLFILFHTVFLIGMVPSSSMEPTLREGSLILGYRCSAEYKTGDVIIFEHDGSLLVKRIAAAGNETVCVDGRTVTVPEGCFYVLGDNPKDSVDSRCWADPFVPISKVRAKVILPAVKANAGFKLESCRSARISGGLFVRKKINKFSPFSANS